MNRISPIFSTVRMLKDQFLSRNEVFFSDSLRKMHPREKLEGEIPSKCWAKLRKASFPSSLRAPLLRHVLIYKLNLRITFWQYAVALPSTGHLSIIVLLDEA